MQKRLLGLLMMCLLLCSGGVLAMSETLVSLPSRPGVQQRYLLIQPEAPQAAVILFAGNKGALQLSPGLDGGVQIDWGRNNFLVRSRADFARQGLMVAVVDAPTDRHGMDGMFYNFRNSDEHRIDIDSVIADLRRRADVPVWLVGTSRGTESATHLAIHSKQQPHGLVLASAMSETNDRGYAVTEMRLGAIALPVLIAANETDRCWVTPPDGADDIRRKLARASKVEVALFQGERTDGSACSGLSEHGFFGIEQQVVSRISAFIKAN